MQIIDYKMYKSKLIPLLKSLTITEVKSFTAFCQSKYFNVNKKQVELLMHLKKFHPDYNNQNLEKSILFKQLFGREEFEEQKLRYVFSDLTLLLEEFLAHSAFQKKELEYKHILLGELFERKQNKFFLQHLRETENNLEQNTFRDSNYFYQQYRMRELSYQYTSIYENHAIDKGLQELANNLDVMYLTLKLKYSCEMINRKNILQVGYQIHFIDELKALVEKFEFIHIPAVAIYYNILQTLTDPINNEFYYRFKKSVSDHVSLFSKKEQREMYTFLQNYCIKRINTGDQEYLDELFENYQTMLDGAILIENRSISQFDFKNIVAIALRLEKFEWTEKFIEQYKMMLDYPVRENAVVYNLSRLYYSKGDHKYALKLLQQVEFDDVFYQLDAKALLLKIFYETDAEESLLSLLSSFKIYLKRNKEISEYQYTVYNNLLKFVKRLFQIKMGGSGKLSDIKNVIATDKKVADLQWLKQKIKELEE